MKLNSDETFQSFSEYKDLISDLTINFESGFIEDLEHNHIVDISRDILESNKILVTFNEEEKRKYNCKPKILSNDVYGTPDLYFIIMLMNEISHPVELDVEGGLYMMSRDGLPELIRVYDYYNNEL